NKRHVKLPDGERWIQVGRGKHIWDAALAAGITCTLSSGTMSNVCCATGGGRQDAKRSFALANTIERRCSAARLCGEYTAQGKAMSDGGPQSSCVRQCLATIPCAV